MMFIRLRVMGNNQNICLPFNSSSPNHNVTLNTLSGLGVFYPEPYDSTRTDSINMDIKTPFEAAPRDTALPVNDRRRYQSRS